MAEEAWKGVIFMKNFAKFTDGREEEIIFHKKYTNGVMFTTVSGVYIARNCLGILTEFLKVVMTGPTVALTVIEEPGIDRIFIDDRFVYEYVIHGDGAYIKGEVLASPDATRDDIRKAIAEDLTFSFEKKEADR